MAKKKVGLANLNFNRIDPYGQQDAPIAKDVAAAEFLSLQAIYPDPDQPRKLLPEPVARALFAGKLTPAAALQQLISTADAANAAPAIRESVAKLRGLAESIANQGQINPITVQLVGLAQMPEGISYLIVTGERRWWAHIYLAMNNRPVREGNSERAPDRIKASIVADGASIRALQLIENLQREDISVLERAYGLVALRDEMIVAHGQQRGAWSKVEELLGMSRAYRSRTLKVLELAPEAQQYVADYGLTERTIRPIAQNLSDKPKLQVAALKQIVTWQQHPERLTERTINASVEKLVDELLVPAAAQTAVKRAPAKLKGAYGAASLRRQIRTIMRDFGLRSYRETLRAELREPAQEELREEIAQLIESLNDILD